MRTLLEVRNEIESIMDGKYTKPREKSAAIARVQFLRLVEMYLKENPTIEFLDREIERLENRNNIIIDSYDEPVYKITKGIKGSTDPKDVKKRYESDMGIPHLKLQIRALRFIKK